MSNQDNTTTKDVGDDAVMVSDTIMPPDQMHTIDSVAVRPGNTNEIQTINTHTYKIKLIIFVLNSYQWTRTMQDMQTTLQHDNCSFKLLFKEISKEWMLSLYQVKNVMKLCLANNGNGQD